MGKGRGAASTGPARDARRRFEEAAGRLGPGPWRRKQEATETREELAKAAAAMMPRKAASTTTRPGSPKSSTASSASTEI